ncbi:MAG: dicarboxylate/amino acid:cation symporter [Bacteroidales bacterium]|nr:dicarboxylate/amino acid:cation symporter [Bacteroidales bacterium]
MKKKWGLTTIILLSLFLGIFCGLAINIFDKGNVLDQTLLEYFLRPVGQMFIAALKMLVVPLVFISIVCGAASLGDIKRVGAIGGSALFFYLFTTAIAISVALCIGEWVSPGIGVTLGNLSSQQPVQLMDSASAVDLPSMLVNIIPDNPIQALATGNMLAIIFFALFIGITLSILGQKVKHVLTLFIELNEVMMKMIDLIMKAAPVGVFALVTVAFAGVGFDLMYGLGKYCLAVLLALLIHFAVTYALLLRAIGGVNPFVFFRKYINVLSLGFSTATSNATIPLAIETLEDRIGVSKSIASFTIPLGATLNMDGTAIMQGVAVVFISQIYGVEMTLAHFLTVIVTATIASVGTAGIPSIGLITLSMVLTSIGLPVEGIALIMGVDRLLDMARTSVNITGDAVCSIIIARKTGALDEKIYYGKQ